MTTPLKTVTDKIVKVSESFTVNMYDNGYMVEVSGTDKNTDWKTAKILVSDPDSLLEVIKQIIQLQRVE